MRCPTPGQKITTMRWDNEELTNRGLPTALGSDKDSSSLSLFFAHLGDVLFLLVVQQLFDVFEEGPKFAFVILDSHKQLVELQFRRAVSVQLLSGHVRQLLELVVVSAWEKLAHHLGKLGLVQQTGPAWVLGFEGVQQSAESSHVVPVDLLGHGAHQHREELLAALVLGVALQGVVEAVGPLHPDLLNAVDLAKQAVNKVAHWRQRFSVACLVRGHLFVFLAFSCVPNLPDVNSGVAFRHATVVDGRAVLEELRHLRGFELAPRHHVGIVRLHAGDPVDQVGLRLLGLRLPAVGLVSIALLHIGEFGFQSLDLLLQIVLLFVHFVDFLSQAEVERAELPHFWGRGRFEAMSVFSRFEAVSVFSRFEAVSVFSRFEAVSVFSRFEAVSEFSRFETVSVFSRFEAVSEFSRFETVSVFSRFEAVSVFSRFEAVSVFSRFEALSESFIFEALSKFSRFVVSVFSRFEALSEFFRFEAVSVFFRFVAVSVFSRFEALSVFSRFEAVSVFSRFEALSVFSRFEALSESFMFEALSKFSRFVVPDCHDLLVALLAQRPQHLLHGLESADLVAQMSDHHLVLALDGRQQRLVGFKRFDEVFEHFTVNLQPNSAGSHLRDIVRLQFAFEIAFELFKKFRFRRFGRPADSSSMTTRRLSLVSSTWLSGTVRQEAPLASAPEFNGLVSEGGGQRIKQLREQLKVWVKTPSRDEPPIFEVTGLPEKLAEAKCHILRMSEHFTKVQQERMQRTEPNRMEDRLYVEQDKVGLIVGANGQTIRWVQQLSDTHIATPRKQESFPGLPPPQTYFTICGATDKVKFAKQLICEYVTLRCQGLWLDPDLEPSAEASKLVRDFHQRRQVEDTQRKTTVGPSNGGGGGSSAANGPAASVRPAAGSGIDAISKYAVSSSALPTSRGAGGSIGGFGDFAGSGNGGGASAASVRQLINDMEDMWSRCSISDQQNNSTATAATTGNSSINNNAPIVNPLLMSAVNASAWYPPPPQQQPPAASLYSMSDRRYSSADLTNAAADDAGFGGYGNPQQQQQQIPPMPVGPGFQQQQQLPAMKKSVSEEQVSPQLVGPGWM
uniref:KH domain-containing protein n=1 Tax=Macrostomum lignano TaxID=282301 RepID=A0A1I8I3Z9_9PLAT